jgi:hypothetical protein
MPIVSNDFDIVNLALDHLHLTQKITAMAQAVPAAQAGTRWYEISRQAILKAHPWKFAEKRAVLVEDTVAANAHPQWEYAYTPPTGLLKLRKIIVEGYRSVPGDYEVRMAWENLPDASAKRIYCDYPPATGSEPLLSYTFDQTDVTKFPDSFVTALSYLLAIRLATPLRVNEKVLKAVLAMWPFVWADAVADDTSDTSHEQPDASWILARL